MANVQVNDTTLNKGSSNSSELQTQYPRADVLLVTVLKAEALAVFDLIKEKFSRGYKTLYTGLNTCYDLGIIGGAKVFMVRSAMGASRSILTVSDSIKELSPSAVIMVGTAFGVDSKMQRIGDILISERIFDYELQRVSTGVEGEQVIIPRGDRPSASPRLLNRFRSGELSWDGPKVWFGPILSGNKIVDNLDFREQLRKLEPGAIGGDMEGAGLHSAARHLQVDWILVKAICDWADGQKHTSKRQRQEEAARNAASFTIHVIEQGGFAKDGPSSFQESSESESVYADQGELHQAEKYHKQSPIVARELGDRQALSTLLQNLGLVFLRLADTEPNLRRFHLSHAAKSLEQAVDVFDTLGTEPLQRAHVRYLLGRCYRRLGRWREAIVPLEQAREMFAQHKARPELARVMLEIGQLYNQSHDFESAYMYLKDALRLFRRIADRDGVAVTQEALGNLALQTSRPSEAMTLFQEARLGYKALERHERVREVDGLLYIAQQACRPQAEKGATL
jgi:nucleoside phosphorylase